MGQCNDIGSDMSVAVGQRGETWGETQFTSYNQELDKKVDLPSMI